MIELIDEKDVSEGKLVEHHVKYKEIHSEDKTVFIPVREHIILHRRLRKEGRCNIPTKELQKISSKAYLRTDKYKNRINNNKIIKNKGKGAHQDLEIMIEHILLNRKEKKRNWKDWAREEIKKRKEYS